MDAQTFLDNFASIAEAPGGVQRLRDLVLRLAVQGQLGTQRDDEPASVTVEKAAHELAGRSGPRGREASVQRLDGDAALFVGPPADRSMPVGWALVPLLAVTRLESGHTPDRKVPQYWDGPIPWIGIRDARANRDGVVSSTEKTITQAGVDNSSTRLLPARTVCLSRTASVGYCVLMGEPMCTSQDFVNFVCTSALLPRYLQVLFMAEREALRRFAKGAVHLTIYFPEVKALHLLLPPVAEQERIVAKVDELMRLCDDLEERQERRHRATTRFRASAVHALTEAETPDDLRHAWERVSTNWPGLTAEPEAVQAMRETILNLAVKGLLVGQSQSDRDAGAEVEQARRAKASIPGLRRQPPIGRAHSAALLPNGWAWATVDDLFLVTGGIQKSSKRRPTKHHFPYLRVANVQRGRLDLREIERFELVDGELARLRLEPGDLLVVEGNGSESEIGRCARWNGEIEDCVHQNHLIRCRPMLPGVEHYLLMFLNSPAGMATMKRLAVTTSGLYNLSVAKIRAISFPLPPMAEQIRIRKKVDSLVQQVMTLKASLEARDSVREALAEVVVATVSA